MRAAAAGAAAGGVLLARLLDTETAYRRRWETRSDRSSAGLNQAGVARVLMQYLNETGEHATDVDSERQLKDRVGRALSGRVLTPRTLEHFIGAFEMPAAHADALRRALRGQEVVPDAPPPPAVRQYRTVQLHENHWIGPDGLPARHRTLHLIEALEDGVDRYPYVFDTQSAAVTVIRGGTASPVVPHEGRLGRADITFDRSLARGETQSFEYETSFSYAEPPPPEFRRVMRRRVDAVELRVEFSPQRVPLAIWWARWQAIEGPIAEQEEVELDGDLSVHRYLKDAEEIVVGFHWRW